MLPETFGRKHYIQNTFQRKQILCISLPLCRLMDSFRNSFTCHLLTTYVFNYFVEGRLCFSLFVFSNFQFYWSKSLFVMVIFTVRSRTNTTCRTSVRNETQDEASLQLLLLFGCAAVYSTQLLRHILQYVRFILLIKLQIIHTGTSVNIYRWPKTKK